MRKNPFIPEESLQDAAEAIYELDPEASIAGGYAMAIYGSDRMTKDLDMLAESEIEGLERGRPLTFGGYKTVVKGVPVDIIIRDDEYVELYREALENATTIEGENLRVVSPEHLVAMKLQSMRTKDEADLLFLLQEEGDEGELLVDRQMAVEIVAHHLGGRFAVDSLRSYFREADWLRSQSD